MIVANKIKKDIEEAEKLKRVKTFLVIMKPS